jgi:hypothetical protein
MKSHLPHLKLGEIVVATVIDNLPDYELLLDVTGDLIRVANETRKPILKGTRIQLRVTAIQPLQFRLIDRRQQRRRGRIDYSI